MSISGSFAATGVSSAFAVPNDRQCLVTIGGTFEGTVRIEQNLGSTAWRTMLTLSIPGAFLLPGAERYRVQCTEYVSGSIDYSLEAQRSSSSGGGSFSGDASDVIYGDTNVAEALDELNAFDQGVPVLIRRTYLIREGIDGIVTGTVDDAQAALNLAAMQSIVDQADDNSAAIECDQQTFHIHGAPLIVRSSAGGVVWDSSTFTTIAQRSNNIGVLQLGDASTTCQNLDFQGCNVHYAADQNGNTNANAITIYNQWKARIGKLQVSNTTTSNRAYRGVYFPQGIAVFSCDFFDWFIFQPRFACMHLANFGTGNAFTNIYNSAVGNSGSAQSITYGMLWEVSGGQQTQDSVFNQINFEWMNANIVMRINNVRGVVFNSLHMEQNIFSGANACLINNIISNIQINSLMLLDNRIQSANASDFPSVHKGFNNGRTNIDTLTWVNNVGSYIDRSFYLHYQSDTDGHNSNPSYLTVKNYRLVDGSGTVLRDNILIDRSMGGTDIDGGVWPAVSMESADEISAGGGVTEIRKGLFRVAATTTLYGQVAKDATIGIPGTLSGNINITLSNRQAPTGSRFDGATVVPGTRIAMFRAGTHTNNAVILNHDGTTIDTFTNGSGTTRKSFFFNGTDWASA